MAKLSVIGKIFHYYKGKKLPPGHYLIIADKKYDDKIEIHANKKEKEETKKGYEIPSLITIETNYNGRTIDQNSLMWALYEIEAHEQNQGVAGIRSQMVTPMELYEADLIEWGKWEYFSIKKESLPYWINQFRKIQVYFGDWIPIHSEKAKNSFLDSNEISLRGIRGTSQYTTIEMSRHIDGIFNRLVYNGIEVSSPEQIEIYWKEWMQYLNDSKIVLHSELMSIDEYRMKVELCEICGNHLKYGDEDYHGHIHHIKTIGMGGDRKKEEKSECWNLLHLCERCHIKWHSTDGGETWAKKNAPWLKYKISRAKRGKYQTK